jgi:hypothetical protein
MLMPHSQAQFSPCRDSNVAGQVTVAESAAQAPSSSRPVGGLGYNVAVAGPRRDDFPNNYVVMSTCRIDQLSGNIGAIRGPVKGVIND